MNGMNGNGRPKDPIAAALAARAPQQQQVDPRLSLDIPPHLRGITCECGRTLPVQMHLNDVHCECGRVHRAPAVDTMQLLRRLDALEREVKELSEWKSRWDEFAKAWAR